MISFIQWTWLSHLLNTNTIECGHSSQIPFLIEEADYVVMLEGQIL